jgi:hypothetical protein
MIKIGSKPKLNPSNTIHAVLAKTIILCLIAHQATPVKVGPYDHTWEELESCKNSDDTSFPYIEFREGVAKAASLYPWA